MTIDEGIEIMDKIKEDLIPFYIKGEKFDPILYLKESNDRYTCSSDWFKFYTMAVMCELHKKYIGWK